MMTTEKTRWGLESLLRVDFHLRCGEVELLVERNSRHCAKLLSSRGSQMFVLDVVGWDERRGQQMALRSLRYAAAWYSRKFAMALWGEEEFRVQPWLSAYLRPFSPPTTTEVTPSTSTSTSNYSPLSPLSFFSFPSCSSPSSSSSSWLASFMKGLLARICLPYSTSTIGTADSANPTNPSNDPAQP